MNPTLTLRAIGAGSARLLTMHPELNHALTLIRQRAALEDAQRAPGSSLGPAAARAARLRKCAQELAGCQDTASGREVLCRHGVLARDYVGRFLHLLAAGLQVARAAPEDSPAAAESGPELSS